MREPARPSLHPLSLNHFFIPESDKWGIKIVCNVCTCRRHRWAIWDATVNPRDVLLHLIRRFIVVLTNETFPGFSSMDQLMFLQLWRTLKMPVTYGAVVIYHLSSAGPPVSITVWYLAKVFLAPCIWADISWSKCHKRCIFEWTWNIFVSCSVARIIFKNCVTPFPPATVYFNDFLRNFENRLLQRLPSSQVCTIIKGS